MRRKQTIQPEAKHRGFKKGVDDDNDDSGGWRERERDGLLLGGWGKWG